jgi:hypothetical protein
MPNIRTEDGVVHLLSPTNGDLGQPLCDEPSKRLPRRGSAHATEDGATCGNCHRRSIGTARARLGTAIGHALEAGVTAQEVAELIGSDRDCVHRMTGTAAGE